MHIQFRPNFLLQFGRCLCNTQVVYANFSLLNLCHIKQQKHWCSNFLLLEDIVIMSFNVGFLFVEIK